MAKEKIMKMKTPEERMVKVIEDQQKEVDDLKEAVKQFEIETGSLKKKIRKMKVAYKKKFEEGGINA